jgi:hypothetical protein
MSGGTSQFFGNAMPSPILNITVVTTRLFFNRYCRLSIPAQMATALLVFRAISAVTG